jgi:diaminohydroxyphosphoribosylaminopyrimidine deaminase/5-amino-6-(5-phosphoribosylamino)uracil reductase
VVDTRLSMDPACRLAQGGEPQVMVAVTREHDHLKAEVLRGRGLEIVETAARDGRVDLEELLSELGRREVASVLVEGGPRLVSSFLKEGLADRLALFVAPRIFADDEAPSWAGGMTTMDPAQGIGFKWTGARRLGEDILLEARVSRW